MTFSNTTIQRAKQSGNPVIHGNRATFIWEGKTAPWLVSDLTDWTSRPKPFKRISPQPMPDPDKTIWSCTLTVPRDAYIEYAFYDPVTQKQFLDPLNRKSVSNGMGGRNNYFYMPETMPSPFAMRRAEVAGGALTRHRVEARWLRDDYEREVYLYRPPVKDAVPLLIVYDGQDYLQRGKLATIVDNLIAGHRIQPIAIAFLPSGGRWRSVEYACSDATLLWLDQIILPLAKEQLNLLDIRKHPGAYGVLGASLGGTMALYTALRMADIFGKALIQSGAFHIEGLDFSVVDLVRHGQGRSVNLWMDVGTLEFLLEDNRAMHALLIEKGYQVTYREYAGGHNFTAWRNDVWRGMEVLFPSPLHPSSRGDEKEA